MHSNIYTYARRILPLSRTLDAVQDPAMRKSCAALHGFVMDMLSDMYDNPEAYHLPVMKWEELLGGKTLDAVKRDYPKKIKAVHSRTTHVASQYMGFLWWVGQKGRIENDAFLISAEDLQSVSKKFSSNTSPIKLEKRLEALNRTGLMTEFLPTNEYLFVSKNYPDMFPALHALPHENLSMLDFRSISGKYKPTHDDYFYSMITEQRERAYELHGYAIERKMRVSLNANWGVLYHYKSKHVMTIRTNDDVKRFVGVSVIGKDRTDPHTVIDEYLVKEPKDLQEQAQRRMSGCDTSQCIMCSTYCSGKYVTVLGKQHQICGEGSIFYDWREPMAADMGRIKRLIDIRCEYIEKMRAEKKAKA